MKAALLDDSLNITIKEIKEPIVKDSEILVEIFSCGVCATDVKKFTGKSSTPYFPFVLGHEPAGTIKEIGKAVHSDLEIGDRIAVAPVVVCGDCYSCKSGLVSSEGMGMCENYHVIGYSKDGAFTEKISLPPENLYKIPDTLSFKEAALVEPIAACANGVIKAMTSPPGKAVIFGAGFMGLASLALFKILGAQVLVIDLLDERLDIAHQLGADKVVNPKESNIEEAVLRFTVGRGADSIICAIGNKEITGTGIRMLSKAGKIVLLASALKDTKVEFNLNEIHYSHSMITGSVSYTKTQFGWAIDILAQDLINTDLLISNVGGLKDVKKFLEMTRDREGLKKVVLIDKE